MDEPLVSLTWQLLLATGAIGIVTAFAMQGVKKLSDKIDTASPVLKQFLILAIAQGLTHLGNFLGVTLPLEIGAIDEATMQGLLGAGFSMGFYEVLKALGLFKKK